MSPRHPRRSADAPKATAAMGHPQDASCRPSRKRVTAVGRQRAQDRLQAELAMQNEGGSSSPAPRPACDDSTLISTLTPPHLYTFPRSQPGSTPPTFSPIAGAAEVHLDEQAGGLPGSDRAPGKGRADMAAARVMMITRRVIDNMARQSGRRGNSKP